ncbi:preprotein translocase subunit SecD [Haloferacaceae archaeon DSL9]
MSAIRDHWRLGLLVVLVLAATFALFSPTMAPQTEVGGDSGAAEQSITNLQYGLDLAGGTRIRAPLVGLTAEAVDFGGDGESEVASNIAAELPNTSTTDIVVRQEFQDEPGTVEVVDPEVSDEQFAAALDGAGYEYDEIRSGVTAETREEAISVLEGKVNQAGLSGSTVREVASGTGEYFILIEVPGEGRQDVIDLIQERGAVQIDIYYPTGDGEYATESAVLTQGDFNSIGTAQQSERGPYVPVTLTPSAAEEFQQTAVETGVAGSGGSVCTYFENPEQTGPCLLVTVDDEVVNAFGMTPDLAQSMQSGEWANSGSFQLSTRDYEDAQRVAINLRAGALPAELDIGPDGSGTSSFISPSQGENFRTYSLLTGIIAVFGVSGVVFLRYREPRVSLPMVVTALSEVYILLGFAAVLGYPLDLAVIAGFIAVIGTGVDDLIIIADEVMSEGSVSSRKVFDSRFKRAFWVIGAAAVTTIIAMSPLAVLSLGDLRGFAIFTILGVLVGVLVTRPAYGDILRVLLTEDR